MNPCPALDLPPILIDKWYTEGTYFSGTYGQCYAAFSGRYTTTSSVYSANLLLVSAWHVHYFPSHTGNGLQYAYSVPHDVNGLRKLFKSDADYVSLLQQQMVNTSMWPFELTFLPSPWYWAGNGAFSYLYFRVFICSHGVYVCPVMSRYVINSPGYGVFHALFCIFTHAEPDVLAPWQFSWVLSDAWRTQYWIRWALDTYYMLTPSGE